MQVNFFIECIYLSKCVCFETYEIEERVVLIAKGFYKGSSLGSLTVGEQLHIHGHDAQKWCQKLKLKNFA